LDNTPAFKEQVQQALSSMETAKLADTYLTQNEYFEFSPRQLVFPRTLLTLFVTQKF